MRDFRLCGMVSVDQQYTRTKGLDASTKADLFAARDCLKDEIRLRRACGFACYKIAHELNLTQNDANYLVADDIIGAAFILMTEKNISPIRAAYRAYRTTIQDSRAGSLAHMTETAEYADYNAVMKRRMRAELGKMLDYTKLQRKAKRKVYCKVYRIATPFVGPKYQSKTAFANMSQVKLVGSYLQRIRANKLHSNNHDNLNQLTIADCTGRVDSNDESRIVLDYLRSRGCTDYVDYRLDGLSDREACLRIGETHRTDWRTIRSRISRRLSEVRGKYADWQDVADHVPSVPSSHDERRRQMVALPIAKMV